MNTKVKTACIATALNIVFTVAKFIIWSLTGSLAVLADAWHSFGDIASSVFVLVTFVRTRPVTKNTDAAKSERQSDSLFEGAKSSTNTQTGTPQQTNEVLISLAIGLVLFAASAVIYHKGSVATTSMLENTVPSGIFFLFFALCSYTLSRFEERVGQSEHSIGLLADASHSKADMIAALITGISLILHSVGLNLDRPAAYIIATLILITAVETVVNSIFALVQNDSSLIQRHKVQDMLAATLKPSTWHKFFDRLENYSATGRHFIIILRKAIRFGSILIPAILLTLFLTTTIYTLDPQQQAIVERLGIPQQHNDPIGPGLHLKLPWPIDRVLIVNTRRIHTLSVGSTQTESKPQPLLWTRRHGQEVPFISGDNSFIYPYASINYTITNLYAYLFNQQTPDALIRHAANQVITHAFNGRTFYDLTISNRGVLEDTISRNLQAKLDRFGCGVYVCDVFLRDIHPPIPIAPAFENVIAAYQEKEQTINEAYGYSNGSIPAARGNAEERIAMAQSVTCKSTNQATGETSRQLAQLSAYKQHPAILQKKLYYQTMLDALTQQKTILVDPRAGRPDLWDNPSDPMTFFGPADAEQWDLIETPTYETSADYNTAYDEDEIP